MLRYILIVFIFLFSVSCAQKEPAPLKIPKVGSTWNIQLDGRVNEKYDVEMYEIDLFDSSENLINRLKARDIKVICYFNGGAWQERLDSNLFPKEALGNKLPEYEKERWLDIRHQGLKPIMKARLDLAVIKGCDGVDPDNMNGWEEANDTGFPLTYENQLEYNKFMAKEAKKRGLSIALKNDWDQIIDLVSYYDFAVSEQCFEYEECYKLKPFIDAGKGVFNIEYEGKYIDDETERIRMCKDSNSKMFSTLIMTDDLVSDSRKYSCN